MTTTMMATTTATAPLSPTHGAGSSSRGGSNTTTTADDSAESSKSHQRRKSGGSSGSAAGGSSSRRNNPMNPAFGMTSNSSAGPSRSPPAPSTSHSSSAAAGSTTSSSRVKRNQKSSDRLHRLGAASGSSTHLAGKRNKSHTQLAGAGVARKRGSSKGQRRAGAGSGDGVNEDGWTSATPEGTRPNSPTAEEEVNASDEEDEGLTMGGRKKPAAAPAAAAPPTTTVKEPTPPPPTISRSDTAATLVAESTTPTPRDEGGPLAFPRRQDDEDAVSSSAHRSRSDSDGTLGENSRATSAAPSSSDATTAADRDTSAPSSSKSTPLKGTSAPGRTQPHLRISSSASNKTLTGSPASTMSRMSTRSRTLSLMPRGGDRHAAAPPMLSTHNALAGNLGAQQERRSNDFMTVPSRSFSSGMTPSPSAPAYLHESGRYDEGRPLRRQGSQASISSNITLPGGSATVGRASRSTVSRGPIPSEAEFEERRRTESTRSLTAADAAKLAAKLRQARDAMDERSGIVTSSSSRGGASASLANAALDGGVGGLGGGARYSKPVVSMFAKEQERRNKPHAVPVTSTSVWSPHFTAAVASSSSTDEARDKAKNRASQQPRCIRYAGLYGLGGPPIEKTPLNDALLAPSFDGDEFEASWAPALANAAGLGARSTRVGGGGGASSDMMQDGTPFHDPTLPLSGSAAVNGPNATPVHLIHGLTAISPEPFPLDPADAPSLHLGGSNEGDSTASLMADPATLRAIALTSQVLSTHRSHEMTRRYYDPMREGLDRALRPSARAALAAAAAAAGGGVGGTTPGATSTTGGANSARRSATAPSSPRSNSGTGGRLGSGQSSRSGPGGGGRHHQQSQSHLHLSSLGEAAAAAANSPVQSLKRVWSSAGASRVTGEARR